MNKYFIKKIYRTVCILLVLLLLTGQAVSASDIYGNGSYLDGVKDLIMEEYYGDVSDDKLNDSAVRGMFNSLDDYTTYYNNEEKDDFIDSITGTFGGIGVTMVLSGEYIVVSDVYSDSPAEKAGVLPGDRIVEADETNLVGAALDKAAYIIKGEPGTTVRLGILRNGSTEKTYIDVVREIIKVNPVTYENRNGIGYIRLDMFNENTQEYISEALACFDKRKIKNVVLDLRDNPGGEVGQAVALAQKFVPEGLITKLDYKSTKYDDQEYYSSLQQQKYKLAVLVNGMSASASEIVSGAIQDTSAGKLIGTRTFGKAKFQSMIPILTEEAYTKYRDMYGLNTVNIYDLFNYNIFPSQNEIFGYAKITLGVYYTPNGRMIDGEGLIPDIVVKEHDLIEGVSITDIQGLSKTAEYVLDSQSSDIVNAKKILRVMGYDVETPGGSFDEEFESALKEYQSAKRIREDGVLNIKTQIALNADLLNLILKYDVQYAAAVNYLKN